MRTRLTKISIENLKVAKSAIIREFRYYVNDSDKTVYYSIEVEGDTRRAYLHNNNNDMILFEDIATALKAIRRHNKNIPVTTL